MSAEHYPPWSFYYRVAFDVPGATKDDTRFQSVSGLSVEYDLEEVREGGENRFVHKLPGRTKYPDLVLKRGMVTDSEVVAWFRDAFDSRAFRPADVSVILLNEKAQPLRTWSVVHAVPKKWTASDLNANENSVVIETLELTYRYFTVSDDRGGPHVTIEIKELHIRVSVTAPTSTAAPAGPSSATTPDDAGGTESVVAACVEQVMDLLRDRSER